MNYILFIIGMSMMFIGLGITLKILFPTIFKKKLRNNKI
jgi:hypothetical protein